MRTVSTGFPMHDEVRADAIRLSSHRIPRRSRGEEVPRIEADAHGTFSSSRQPSPRCTCVADAAARSDRPASLVKEQDSMERQVPDADRSATHTPAVMYRPASFGRASGSASPSGPRRRWPASRTRRARRGACPADGLAPPTVSGGIDSAGCAGRPRRGPGGPEVRHCRPALELREEDGTIRSREEVTSRVKVPLHGSVDGDDVAAESVEPGSECHENPGRGIGGSNRKLATRRTVES